MEADGGDGGPQFDLIDEAKYTGMVAIPKALPSMLAKELLREGGSVICNIRRKICSVRWQFSTRVWMCMQEAGHIELMASRARARAWKDRTSTSPTTDGARLARRWIKQVLPLGGPRQ